MSAMYNFLFDRKSLALLILGAAVGGGVLFFAGVLVGVYWSLPYGTTLQAQASPRPAERSLPQASSLPAPAPAQPAALPSSPASERPETSAAPAPSGEERIELPKPLPEPNPRESQPPVIDPPIGLPKTSVGAEPIPEPPPIPAPRPRRVRPQPVPEEAPPAPSAPTAAPALLTAAGEGRYTVQVGAYSLKENSEETLSRLSRRGYSPYVAEIASTRGVLLTVRLGRYADRATATRAAAEFRRKERMDAIVQPVAPESRVHAVAPTDPTAAGDKAAPTSG